MGFFKKKEAPELRGDLQEAKGRLAHTRGYDILFTSVEDELMPNETVISVFPGTGIAVLTSSRVLLWKMNLRGPESIDIPLSRITSAKLRSKVMSSEVVVTAADSEIEISGPNAADAKAFVDAVRGAVAA